MRMTDVGLHQQLSYHYNLVCFSLHSIEDNYKQFWTAICNLRRLHTTFYSYI